MLTHFIVDILKTFMREMCAGFISELPQGTALPQPTSSFLDLPSVCIYGALSCPALALCFSTRQQQPHLLSSGLREPETGPDTQDAYASSCVHFLPQPSLHLAVLLFKKAVSCSLLTSILSGLCLAPNQQAISLCPLSSFPGELVDKSRKEHGRWSPSPFR